jgi:Fic family protein
MQLPVAPPDVDALLDATFAKGSEQFSRVLSAFAEVDEQGRYLHWDKLRHLPTPSGFSSEDWWLGIKMARRKSYKPLPLQDKRSDTFRYCLPVIVQKELHFLDRQASGSIQAEESITNPQTKNTYLIRSLIEEAINSSQLEGASTTQNVAKEMIRQNREPRNKSEQMIFNNYLAMEFIREHKNEPLTPSIIFELQRH